LQNQHESQASLTFSSLLTNESLLAALNAVGYESPSPIQAATIPVLLEGRDVVGQAQTGTGKTAAFALPILARIDLDQKQPQALVLVPTRELAIQVAEAFQRYASHLEGFHVVPIYGGQSYSPQLHALRRGAHVVVGTPGRLMDHIKRETLRLSAIRHFVLDEADEMLRMGFIDDVEWILEQAPKTRQVALFSATMPPAIRRIAQRYLRDPAEVTIQTKTKTAEGIRQRYWMLSGMHKLDALTRILEVEPFDAMLVFTRTKVATEELAERLEARGFAAEALNGDIAQAQRERTITRLKNGQVDIVVATDVAARGLDVERVSHVVNFDVPYDPESYVHRIGRTGRAGRTGEAILFIAPRERNMLRVIERATRKPIERMELPTIADVNERRIVRFNERITDALASGAAEPFKAIIENYERAHNVPASDVAAALASLLQGKKPLLIEGAAAPTAETTREPSERREFKGREASEPRRERKPANERPAAVRSTKREYAKDAERLPTRARSNSHEAGMETFRMEVGRVHGVTPRNIVGAIANEAGLEGQFIGRVVIEEDHSFVDLPEGMPKEVFLDLQKVRVGGQKLQISRALKTQAERLNRDRTDEAHKPPRKRKPPKK
jgi:ATP-dependent RNA helicase DeaD